MHYRTLLLALFATCGLAAKNRTLAATNSTLSANKSIGSSDLVIYNGDALENNVYYNGTVDGLAVAHRSARKNDLLSCFASAAKYGSMAISIYTAANTFSKSQAIACIEGLRNVAANNCDKKYYTAQSGYCTCMFKFGKNVVNDRNAAGETWFKYMKDRVDDITFMGSTVFEYDVNGDDMIGAAVECTNSFAGISNLVTRWSRGQKAGNYQSQWHDNVKYYRKARDEMSIDQKPASHSFFFVEKFSPEATPSSATVHIVVDDNK
ncbi:hypothetical protein BGZ72_009003 [Mortierella alpina]|nr:hypothetical protein BGZ72_009003 [Mortierella alpina]